MGSTSIATNKLRVTKASGKRFILGAKYGLKKWQLPVSLFLAIMHCWCLNQRLLSYFGRKLVKPVYDTESFLHVCDIMKACTASSISEHLNRGLWRSMKRNIFSKFVFFSFLWCLKRLLTHNWKSWAVYSFHFSDRTSLTFIIALLRLQDRIHLSASRDTDFLITLFCLAVQSWVILKLIQGEKNNKRKTEADMECVAAVNKSQTAFPLRICTWDACSSTQVLYSEAV